MQFAGYGMVFLSHSRLGWLPCGDVYRMVSQSKWFLQWYIWLDVFYLGTEQKTWCLQCVWAMIVKIALGTPLRDTSLCFCPVYQK